MNDVQFDIFMQQLRALRQQGHDVPGGDRSLEGAAVLVADDHWRDTSCLFLSVIALRSPSMPPFCTSVLKVPR